MRQGRSEITSRSPERCPGSENLFPRERIVDSKSFITFITIVLLGNPLASPGRGRGGEGSGPAHYAKRRAPPPPPRGKGKRVRFSRRRGASMSARQARPLRRRPEPARPSFNFTSGFGAKAASKRVPCLRQAAPGAEGRARGARAPGVGGWREPGGRGIAGQRARDETSRIYFLSNIKKLEQFSYPSSKSVIKQRRQLKTSVNTFGPGTANKHTVQWWLKKFCKGESLENEEHDGEPWEVDNDQLRAIIELHEKLQKNSAFTLLGSLGSKGEKA
ncbi:uncharacterized protein LOC117078170 [Trachypithecus francoisi]|uniref:uncharacterized protein LOC117078170 n=1 Tax=Trachypithecus francoisi TaxID=54180 RepID=UPI00141BEBB2|nr:uncharacterized protein LOC117078170 [Trachypithecus francoisi]